MPRALPVIGLTCSQGQNKGDYDFTMRRYAAWVVENGGVPLLIPNIEDETALHQVLDLIDGLFLTGGVDPAAELFGEEPHPTITVHAARDTTELVLLKEARRRRMPMFGLCRGIQMMVVAFGGDIWQDLSMRDQETFDHRQSDNADEPRMHDVTLVDNCYLQRLIGASSISTNTAHHQLVRKLPEGFVASGYTHDGVVG